MKKQNLIAIREHLKDTIEGYRKRLAGMWERGQRTGPLYDRLLLRKQLSEEKYDDVIQKICPLKKTTAK